jgi:hypothetical protein
MKSIVRSVGEVVMPEFGNQMLYMHPLDVQNPVMPKEFKRWDGLVHQLMKRVPLTEGEVYITIDEKLLKPGTTHRRPGAHIDGIWDPKLVDHDDSPGHRTHLFSKNPGGGLLLVSNAVGCTAYPGEFEGSPGTGGDCEHMRKQFSDALTMQASTVYLCNVFGIHESIPVTQPVQRSLVRISLPEQAMVN